MRGRLVALMQWQVQAAKLQLSIMPALGMQPTSIGRCLARARDRQVDEHETVAVLSEEIDGGHSRT